MKYYLLQIKQNIWLVPSLYCVAASLLAFGVIYLDTVHGETIVDIIPAIILISVDLAQTILGTIAAALLTMITITFSTIMVVLTTYSTQFSPRTLSDFISNKVTMRVLGVYMGGIMYSILTLLFMREDLTHEVIAGPIGVLIAIICLAFFAYFIHHVATNIQVSTLINDVTMTTLKTVKDRITAKKGEEIKITSKKPNFPAGKTAFFHVKNKELGYIQLIEFHHLFKLAKEKDLVIEVKMPIGTFVKPGDILITVYYESDSAPPFKSKKYIKIGNDRTILQDVEFGVRKIVEVTLRAISPGINDPNTAIDCIFHLGKLLAEASKLDGNYISYYDNDKGRIVAVQSCFDDVLYATFYQICHYGRKDISVLLAIYEALIIIAEENGPSIRKKVWDCSKYIYENFDVNHLHEMDLPYLDAKKNRLRELVLDGMEGSI